MPAFIVEIIYVTLSLMGIIPFFSWIEVGKAKKGGRSNCTISGKKPQLRGLKK